MNTAFWSGVAVGGLMVPCLVIVCLFFWLLLTRRSR